MRETYCYLLNIAYRIERINIRDRQYNYTMQTQYNWRWEECNINLPARVRASHPSECWAGPNLTAQLLIGVRSAIGSIFNTANPTTVDRVRKTDKRISTIIIILIMETTPPPSALPLLLSYPSCPRYPLVIIIIIIFVLFLVEYPQYDNVKQHQTGSKIKSNVVQCNDNYYYY